MLTKSEKKFPFGDWDDLKNETSFSSIEALKHS